MMKETVQQRPKPHILLGSGDHYFTVPFIWNFTTLPREVFGLSQQQ
jgi:hypothetical protein